MKEQIQQLSAPRDAVSTAGVRRRGIIFVHGLGEQRSGETLNYMGRPLVQFVEEGLGDSYEVRKEVRFSPEAGAASAKLQLFAKDGETEAGERRHKLIPEEEWTIVEAWWARSFIPSPGNQSLAWAFVLGLRRIPSIWYGFIERVFAGRYRIEHENRAEGQKSQNTRLSDKGVSEVPWAGAPEAYHRKGRLPGIRTYEFLLGCFWLPILWILYVLSMPVLFALYLLAGLPIVGGFIGGLQAAFADFLFQGLGDQYAMTRNLLARDSANAAILDALQPWIDVHHSAFLPFESVTVIAHSGGAVPAFDALTSPEMSGWLKNLRTSFRGDLRPKLAFYTLGSGLNAAYAMERASPLWKQPFPEQLRWTDIWTQYDFVPAGPIDKELVARSLRLSKDKEFVDLRVANQDNPFTDHGAYFGNREEVLARVLDSVIRLRIPGTVTQEGSVPSVLQKEIDKNIGSIDSRHKKVAVGAFWIPIVIMVLAIVSYPVGAYVFAINVAQRALSNGSSRFDSIPLPPLLPWLALAVAVLFVGWRVYALIPELKKLVADGQLPLRWILYIIVALIITLASLGSLYYVWGRSLPLFVIQVLLTLLIGPLTGAVGRRLEASRSKDEEAGQVGAEARPVTTSRQVP